MKSLSFALIFALMSLGFCLQAYNPTLAMEFWKISGIAYCGQQSIQNWNCGFLCNDLKGKVSYVHYYENNTFKGGLSYFMSRDDSNKFFITAFRGTNSPDQLVWEIMQGTNVLYKLHNISGATVTNYFYSAYKDYLRNDFMTNIKAAIAKYPTYTFVFTGHSLGGALTTHAALDVVLSNLLPSSRVILYNYGSPRVGNFKFASTVNSKISVVNRLVHYKDIVPHVPPCVTNTKGECQPTEGEVYGIPWPAWHIWPNQFYNENSTSYVTCNGGEDPKCADQYTLAESSTKYHGNYLGLTISCGTQEIFPTDGPFVDGKDLFEYLSV